MLILYVIGISLLAAVLNVIIKDDKINFIVISVLFGLVAGMSIKYVGNSFIKFISLVFSLVLFIVFITFSAKVKNLFNKS